MHIIRKTGIFFLAASMLFYVTIGCDGPERPATPMADAAITSNMDDRSEKNLADFQYHLLELAMDTATAIPVDPHIKDRSKAQEKVVLAFLELEEPDLALRALGKIDNWRRGTCFAKLGFYYAQMDRKAEAGKYLEAAGKIAETAEDWRKDRINVEIARVLTLLGRENEASELESKAENSEKGKIAQVDSMITDKSGFNEQMNALDALIATGDFDILHNALGACVELFGKFYEDELLRLAAENKIRQSWSTLPVFIKMQLLMNMARVALAHSDQAKALALVNETQQHLDDSTWQPENRIAQAAQIAGLRYLAGDHEKALADAESVRSFFDQQRDFIVDIWRAGAIRPLAEAYQSMGDTEMSLELYKIAVEEGMKNPNSRPRAEDLSATCISLAMNSIEPDEELWMQIDAIRQGLNIPW